MRTQERIMRVVSLVVSGVFLFIQANLAFANNVGPYSNEDRYLMPVYEEIFVTPSLANVPEPENLLDVVLQSPVLSKESDGNVTVSFPRSKFSVRIDKEEGNTESLKSGQARNKGDYEGSLIDWIVNVLTHTRTTYNRYGKPMYDIDFEGNRVAFYEYDGNNNLEWKIDIYGNKTIYDNEGKNALLTLDFEGNVIATFDYDDPRTATNQPQS